MCAWVVRGARAPPRVSCGARNTLRAGSAEQGDGSTRAQRGTVTGTQESSIWYSRLVTGVPFGSSTVRPMPVTSTVTLFGPFFSPRCWHSYFLIPNSATEVSAACDTVFDGGAAFGLRAGASDFAFFCFFFLAATVSP